MISRETIDKIFDAARIEEVVGDFVSLRKRGANMLGLCPFHNEKTPSFTVSPAKGIYKCFGCGEGGNSIDFVMKHETFSYPEALRYIAQKYNIEIEEKEQSPEEKEAQSQREGMFNINSFASEFFKDQMLNTDIGKSVALSYCRNRGISDESIKKFAIGYSPDGKQALSTKAKEDGYNEDYLVKTGLCSKGDGWMYDRFRSRLIFPIHNISGRIVGFGGRLMISDPKKPKYLNSPDSEIYNKSYQLYGIYFAKSAITSKDNCYLVEGYTDVISLHQAGVENVVASSGTSLTKEQIRLIKRFSSNITMIFDGDAAGIKASFRGIDLVLQEGLNVKIVPMPEGEDPDSFAQKHRSAEVEEYFTKNAADFISFKAKLLMEDVKNDPVKKAGMLKDLIRSIALIPDPLIRNIYIKECSDITQMEESKLNQELNRQLRATMKKEGKFTETELIDLSPKEEKQAPAKPQFTSSVEPQERDLIRILINYGHIDIPRENESEIEGEEILTDDPKTYGELIVNEIGYDEIDFLNPLYQRILNLYRAKLDEGEYPNGAYFINNEDQEISKLTVDLISTPHQLSHNWFEKQRIITKTEQDLLSRTVDRSLLSFRLKTVERMLEENAKAIQQAEFDDEKLLLISRHNNFLKMKKKISEALGRIITR